MTAIKAIKGCHKVYAVHQEGVYVVLNLFPSYHYYDTKQVKNAPRSMTTSDKLEMPWFFL